MKLLLSLLFAVVVLAVILYRRYSPEAVLQSDEHFYVVLIWLVIITVGQISQIPASTFAALTEQAKQDVPTFIQTLLTQGLRLTVVIIGFGAIALSLSHLAGGLFVLAAYFFLYRSYPKGSFDWGLAKEYVKIGLPITVMVFCNYQVENLDKVLLQYYSNSEQVGIYVAGFSVGGFVRTIGVTVGMLFFPLFSSAVARNDFEFIDRTLNKFQRFTHIFIMPAVVLAVLYAKEIVAVVLGPKYTASAPVMAVMVTGMFFYVVNIPYGNLLMGMNRIRSTAAYHVIGLVVFVILEIVLVGVVLNDSQALGTAIAVAASTIVLGYLFRVTVWYLTASLHVWKHEKYLLVGLVVGYAGYVVNSVMLASASHIVVLLFSLVVLAVLFGTLFLLGWATKEDFQLAAQVVNLRRLGSYLKHELGDKDSNG